MLRTASEVAAQAVIYGALGFRASLEATIHRRTEELCDRLLPWLDKLGIGSRIEDYHRAILDTSHGALPPEFRTEAYWRGESASVLGWPIRLLDVPDPISPIDPALLVSAFAILQPDVPFLLHAAFRPRSEIDEYCAWCLEVRHQFQLASVSPEIQAKLKGIHRERFVELGLAETKRMDVKAAEFVSASPNARGIYIERAMTCEWLLGEE